MAFKNKVQKIMKFLIFFFLALIPFVVQANETKPDLDAFGAWPVLHDGRIKTMESFSRSVFYTIAKDDEVNGVSSLAWMTATLFDPSSTLSIPFIKMGRTGVLDLKDSKDKYYSMNDVMSAMTPHKDMILALEQRDPSMLSASQKEMLNAYQAVSLYNQIILSFSAILPLQGQDKSYLDGGGVAEQRALILKGGQDNNLLKLIPDENPSMPMISVWQAVNDAKNTPLINDLKIMAQAWNEDNFKIWSETAKKYSRDNNNVELTLEHYYVTLQPILWVIIFYILGVAFLLFSKTVMAGKFIIGTGFIIHFISLLTRGYIMGRPPTGTLYETLLFGAAVIVMVGLFALFKNKNNAMFIGVCAISAAFLLFISRGFIQGDSLNVLVAVLNTNFWLSTHVTCIIIGYSFCVMAAMVGHVYLWSGSITSEKMMVPLTLIALLFTSIGTLLGGIWADQSWGRFWGWDPKENGALLIVLWLAWILHGRVSGHFKKRGFAAALSLTNIMVALTWFGVNLLGVGLHSYGFISGIALGLGSFIILQILIVVGLYFKRNHA